MTIALLIIGWLLAVVGFVLWRRCANFYGDALEESTQRYEELNAFLGGFSTLLQHHKDSDEALSGVARRTADRLGAASVCIYEFRDGSFEAAGLAGGYPLILNSNSLIMTRPAHILEALKREKFPIGFSVLGEIAETREPELIPDASQDPRFAIYPDYHRLGSILVAPLLHDARVIGLIVAVNDDHSDEDKTYVVDQYELFNEITSQIAVALLMAQSYAEANRKIRIDQELEFARQIQSSLLPETQPVWGQFEVKAFTRSAKEVNGDFYDFVEIDDSRLLVVIGDACGKGVPACMLTAMTRSFIRAAAVDFQNLGSFLHEINRNLYSDTDADRFVSIGCCLIDRKQNLVEFARAGHTEMVTFVNGHIRRINPAGTVLGMMTEELVTFDTICLQSADATSYLFYSDGINEALSPDGEEYGIDRMVECYRQSRLRGDTPDVTLEAILREVEEFAPEQNDDQTLVLITNRGARP